MSRERVYAENTGPVLATAYVLTAQQDKNPKNTRLTSWQKVKLKNKQVRCNLFTPIQSKLVTPLFQQALLAATIEINDEYLGRGDEVDGPLERLRGGHERPEGLLRQRFRLLAESRRRGELSRGPLPFHGVARQERLDSHGARAHLRGGREQGETTTHKRAFRIIDHTQVVEKRSTFFFVRPATEPDRIPTRIVSNIGPSSTPVTLSRQKHTTAVADRYAEPVDCTNKTYAMSIRGICEQNDARRCYNPRKHLDEYFRVFDCADGEVPHAGKVAVQRRYEPLLVRPLRRLLARVAAAVPAPQHSRVGRVLGLVGRRRARVAADATVGAIAAATAVTTAHRGRGRGVVAVAVLVAAAAGRRRRFDRLSFRRGGSGQSAEVDARVSVRPLRERERRRVSLARLRAEPLVGLVYKLRVVGAKPVHAHFLPFHAKKKNGEEAETSLEIIRPHE